MSENSKSFDRGSAGNPVTTKVVQKGPHGESPLKPEVPLAETCSGLEDQRNNSNGGERHRVRKEVWGVVRSSRRSGWTPVEDDFPTLTTSHQQRNVKYLNDKIEEYQRDHFCRFTSRELIEVGALTTVLAS